MAANTATTLLQETKSDFLRSSDSFRDLTLGRCLAHGQDQPAFSAFRLSAREAIQAVIDTFAFGRTMFVLANTIRIKNYAGRISPENKAWAQTIPVFCEYPQSVLVDRCDPDSLDLFTNQVRKDFAVVQLDLPELWALMSLLRRSSNNLNQLARRANETKRIYPEDLTDIRQNQAQLWESAKEILRVLSTLDLASSALRKKRRSVRRVFEFSRSMDGS